jgi:hypothetical protein
VGGPHWNAIRQQNHARTWEPSDRRCDARRAGRVSAS